MWLMMDIAPASIARCSAVCEVASENRSTTQQKLDLEAFGESACIRYRESDRMLRMPGGRNSKGTRIAFRTYQVADDIAAQYVRAARRWKYKHAGDLLAVTISLLHDAVLPEVETAEGTLRSAKTVLPQIFRLSEECAAAVDTRIDMHNMRVGQQLSLLPRPGVAVQNDDGVGVAAGQLSRARYIADCLDEMTRLINMNGRIDMVEQWRRLQDKKNRQVTLLAS
ncbi:hypothetical protein D5S17_36195 [Pseudonocardiaceae bacterium YIM PH 21723]|nr:hypothetical protein D5S17_36195 [Pseudonocardiaceae bacterium YIM PH 21723]